ncbi:MAG: hypothetical protein MUF60_05115 [Vicinamibacterales bacterium]|nr:hypothetical protein [Vicinamibacterales bacterium]
MDDLLEGWEDWIAFFEARLPQPLDRADGEDGGITYTSGQPGEVVVRLTRATITVSEFAVAWDGGRLVPAPRRLGSLRWRRIGSSRAIAIVEQLLAAAREARRSRYLVCRSCERPYPPEWMHDEVTCQECAEAHVGVVH